MLKLLIKRQLYQYFSGFIINAKTNKPRTKKSIIGTIALYAFVIVVCGISFFGMSTLLSPLLETEYAWLFYAIFGMLAIILGVFVSCFSASSYIYKAKDNDLLLSMPINPKDILLSRIVAIYVLSLIYSSWVWVPICINGWISGNPTTLTIIFDILLLFIVGIFVTALSCAIGYVISSISSKFKNRSIVTVIVSLIAFGAYYFLMFRLENIMGDLVNNPSGASEGIKNFVNILYQLGMAATGSIKAFSIFTIVSAALFNVVFFVLSISFTKIATKSDVARITNAKVKYEKSGNQKSALFKKELKRFTSSALYMMNTGLGVVFILAAAIVAIVKKPELDGIIVAFASDISISWLLDFLPLMLIIGIVFIVSVDCISCPSISLEGKTLWQLKVLPVNTYDIFEAKERLHVLINGIPTLISSIVLCYCLNIEMDTALKVVIVLLLFIDLHAWVGLLLGLLRPNFTWTNEAQPIKQSINILFVMLFGVIYVVLVGGGFYLLKDTLDINSYLTILVVINMVAIILIRKWFRTKGVEKFKEL